MLAIQDQMQGSGLSNSQPGAQASTGQAKKHASRVLKYDLGWTLHAGTDFQYARGKPGLADGMSALMLSAREGHYACVELPCKPRPIPP